MNNPVLQGAYLPAHASDNLRISTMTQVTNVNSHVELSELFQNIPIGDKISYAVHGYTERGVSGKKTSPKSVEVNGKMRKRYFFNQVTLHVNVGKRVNMKIFNNGGIQMTGLKTPEQGTQAVTTVLDCFKGLSPLALAKIFTTNSQPIQGDSRMVMINSDFDIGCQIDREKLHREIIGAGYYSSYASDIYPGVNIKYYENGPTSDGVCRCETMCNGKGLNGHCKKITIAVFKSGKIIITGGQTMNHIHVAHSFICKFIKDHPESMIK